MSEAELVHCGCTEDCINLVSKRTRRRHWKVIEEEEHAAQATGPSLLEENTLDPDPGASSNQFNDDITEEESTERAYTLREDAGMEDDLGPDGDVNHDDDEVDIMGEEGGEAYDRYGGVDIEMGMVDADMVSTPYEWRIRHT
jgi:hypothetical protein